jgi:hypothetical protein
MELFPLVNWIKIQFRSSYFELQKYLLAKSWQQIRIQISGISFLCTTQLEDCVAERVAKPFYYCFVRISTFLWRRHGFFMPGFKFYEF